MFDAVFVSVVCAYVYLLGECQTKGMERPKIELPVDMKTAPLGKDDAGVSSVGQRIAGLWTMALQAVGLRKKVTMFQQLAVSRKVMEERSKALAAKSKLNPGVKGSHIDPTKALGDTKKAKSTGSILQKTTAAINKDRRRNLREMQRE